MMKLKSFPTVLAAALILSQFSGVYAVANMTSTEGSLPGAAGTTSVVSEIALNNKAIELRTFLLGGDTYVKLRDVAAMMNGTSKSFEVVWDKSKNTVELTSNEAYTPVGGELATGSAITGTAKPMSAKVYLDDKELQLEGYSIGNNNYFKLSDITEALGLTVDQDETTGIATINTGIPWMPITSIDFSSKQNVMIKSEDGSLTPMNVPYYKATLIAPGTWQILTDGDYCYLVEGDEEAIMIDTGYGAGNIREYAQSLTGKPIKYVVNTHYHFDHTANNAYFDCAYMSADSVPYATIPGPSFEGINFPNDYPIVTIAEGYKFQLGNRELEVYEIPNHTVGGIALLDRKERILFSGDEFIMDKSVSLNCSVAQFAENMSKLEAIRSEFDTLCGGFAVLDASVVDNFYANAQYIISGQSTPDTSTSGSGMGSGSGSSDSESTDSSQIIYTRHMPHPEDMAAKAANPNTVKVTYSNCTISYDSRKVND